MSANCCVFSCTLGLALCLNALSAILRRLRNSLVRPEMIGLMVKLVAKYGIPAKKILQLYSSLLHFLGFRVPRSIAKMCQHGKIRVGQFLVVVVYQTFTLRSWRRLRRGSWWSRAWRTRRGRRSWTAGRR